MRKSARFRVGQCRSPYPGHYSRAFAFSAFLYGRNVARHRMQRDAIWFRNQPQTAWREGATARGRGGDRGVDGATAYAGAAVRRCAGARGVLVILALMLASAGAMRLGAGVGAAMAAILAVLKLGE